MQSRRVRSKISGGVAALLAAALFDGQSPSHAATAAPQPVKVLLISMFGPEGQPWIDGLGLDRELMVPGLSADYPSVRCNADDVCQLTTGMGHANVAASVTAVIFSGLFDLSESYF